MTAAVVDLAVERDYARLKEILTLHPEIRDRTFAALNEEIPMGNENSLTIRIDTDLIVDLDLLVAKVATMPEYKNVGRVTRSMVARLAIVKGVEVLREQTKAGKE